MANSLGSWLIAHKHSKIFLYAKNRVEWTVTDIACWNYGTTNIPLYDTLGMEAFQHIIKLTQGTAIFTTNDLTNNLIENLKKDKASINTVVYFDSPSEDNLRKLTDFGLKVFEFRQLLNEKTL